MDIRWKRNLALIWFSQFLSMAAFSSSYTFIPFYFKHIGLSGETLGWYVALFAAVGNVSFAAAAPVWGIVADVCGRRPMLLRANFAAALLIPLMGVIHNADLLVFHRFLLGAVSGTVTAAQTLVLSTTPANRRSFALGTIASALFSGAMTGQFLGGPIVSMIGFSNTFLASGILLGISGLLVLAGVREHFTPPPNRLAVFRSGFKFGVPRFGRVWYIMLLFVCMSIARDLDGPFMPLMVDSIVHDNDLALKWSGYISGFCSAAAILSGLSLGYLADRTKLIVVLLAVVLVAGLLRFPQALATSLGGFIVFRVLTVMFAGGIEPLLQSWLAGSTPEKEHGRYFGWAACFKAIGWTSGSLLGGLLIQTFDNNVRAVFVGAALLFLLLVPLIRLVYIKVPPPERRRPKSPNGETAGHE